MRAAVYHGRHDIRVESRPEPRLVHADDVVLSVERAAICGTDSSEWAHGPLLVPLHDRHPGSGHRGSVVLGHEFAGRVTEAGPDVTELMPGDLVVCGAGVSCGTCGWCSSGRTNLCAGYYTLGLHADGGLAQLVRCPARTCRVVPKGVSAEHAALAQPLAVALHGVRRGGIGAGETAVVIGVGGIGAFVVAAAASRDPACLIAVDVDEERLETARKLGATVSVHARAGDVTRAILDATSGEGAHVVVEASGAPAAPALAFAVCRRGGRVVLIGLQAAPRELDLRSCTLREVDLVSVLAHVCDIDLPEALQLLASTELASIVTERVIPLSLVVEEGISVLAAGKARGKIVVDVDS